MLRFRSGQTRWTVNPLPKKLHRFESYPQHKVSSVYPELAEGPT